MPDLPPRRDPPAPYAWAVREPGRLIGKGHPAGDFLEAYRWDVLDEREGLLRVRAHVPEHVKNPRGQMFGGFTPTYVDLVSLFAARAHEGGGKLSFRSWLATTNMRVDYFEPLTGPEFEIQSRVVKRRGRTIFVETRFVNSDGKLAVFAVTTLREVPLDRLFGDV